MSARRSWWTHSIATVLGVALCTALASQAQAVDIRFDPWDWVITVDPLDPTGAPAGQPVDIPVWGNAVVRFDDSNIPGGLGTQDNPLALPEGQPITIPIEIVSMDLSSGGMGPIPLPGLGELGTVDVRLTPGTPALGEILVENQGGTLFGDSFFDIFVDVDLTDQAGNVMELTTDPTTPLRLGMPFGRTEAIPAADVFWLPSWIWLENVPGSQLPPPLLIGAGVPNPWDVIVDVHGHITPPIPEPVSATLALMGLGALGLATRRRAA